MVKPDDVPVSAPYQDFPHNFDVDTVSDESLPESETRYLETSIVPNIDFGLMAKATHMQPIQDVVDNGRDRLTKIVCKMYREAGWDVRVERIADLLVKFHFHVYIQRLVLDHKFTEFRKMRASTAGRGPAQCERCDACAFVVKGLKEDTRFHRASYSSQDGRPVHSDKLSSYGMTVNVDNCVARINIVTRTSHPTNAEYDVECLNVRTTVNLNSPAHREVLFLKLYDAVNQALVS
jgi:hypothetical protein